MREVEILEFLHVGLRNADIVTRLGVSTRTVETEVSSISCSAPAAEQKKKAPSAS